MKTKKPWIHIAGAFTGEERNISSSALFYCSWNVLSCFHCWYLVFNFLERRLRKLTRPRNYFKVRLIVKAFFHVSKVKKLFDRKLYRKSLIKKLSLSHKNLSILWTVKSFRHQIVENSSFITRTSFMTDIANT